METLGLNDKTQRRIALSQSSWKDLIEVNVEQ